MNKETEISFSILLPKELHQELETKKTILGVKGIGELIRRGIPSVLNDETFEDGYLKAMQDVSKIARGVFLSKENNKKFQTAIATAIRDRLNKH